MNPSMNSLPDVLLVEVLSFLPSNAFLPIGHVCKRFHETWLRRVPVERMHIKESICDEEVKEKTPPLDCHRRTNPLQLGNLFQTHWNKPSILSTLLLDYYVSCGWKNDRRMRQVLLESAARGDIAGMTFLVNSGLCLLDNADLCTVAGAAGHLVALRWLREEQHCPWDPSEVLREASENNHLTIMRYVELNSAGYVIQSSCYGDGLPW